MKIPEIKRLIDNHSIEDLMHEEELLLNDSPLQITVNGEDEGEQLTHLMAAIWCKRLMEEKNIELKDAVREYTIKVRASIN